MRSDDPIAFMFTWSSYGTWLPGDARGWVKYRRGFRLPDPIIELESAARMTEDACILSVDQRQLVQQQVAETCQHKGWLLHAVNCRTNHVHVVLSTTATPKTVRGQLKAWCTRRLKERQVELGILAVDRRINWWAERGSIRWIFQESDLAAAIEYVRDQQDNPRRFAK